jgi:hypothetical protein
LRLKAGILKLKKNPQKQNQKKTPKNKTEGPKDKETAALPKTFLKLRPPLTLRS